MKYYEFTSLQKKGKENVAKLKMVINFSDDLMNRIT